MTNNQELAEAFAELGRAFANVAAVLRRAERLEPPTTRSAHPVEARSPAARERSVPKQKPLVVNEPEQQDDVLTKGARKVLAILAQVGRPLSTAQIAFWLGVSKGSGSICQPLADLRRLGMIDGDSKAIRINSAGLEALGEFTPLPTGHALFRFWCDKLGSAAERVLCILRDANQSMSSADIARALNVTPGSGSICQPLADLRRMQLIAGGGKAIELSPDFRRAIEPTISVFDKSANRTVKVDRSTGHAR